MLYVHAPDLRCSRCLFMQWDAVENKTSVAIYGGGALVFLWLSSTIVGAVNAVPLVRRPISSPPHLVPTPCPHSCPSSWSLWAWATRLGLSTDTSCSRWERCAHMCRVLYKRYPHSPRARS